MDGPDFNCAMRDRLFLLSGIFGLGTLAVLLILSRVGPRQVGPLPPGFITPVMAFEFARTQQEVEQLFQPPGSAAGMDRVNRWDFLFMTCYSLLLGTYALAVASRTGRSIFYVAVALAPLIWLADVIENVQLLGLTRGLALGDDPGLMLARLRVATGLKWAGLSVYFLLLAGWFRSRGGLWRVAQALAFLPAIFGLSTLVVRGLPHELMALAIGLLFIVLTADAWRWAFFPPAAVIH